VSRTPSAALPCPPAPRRWRRLASVPFAVLTAVLILLGVSAPAAAAPAPAFTETAHSAHSAYGDAVVSTATSLEGTPYRWGGTTPAGFDCSGFVGYVYRIHGKSLPRTAAQMRAAVPSISARDVVAGDLVFVHRGGRVSHVAIVTADGRWWEATRPGRLLGLHKPWTPHVSFGRP